MLKSVANNINKKVTDIKLFEIAKTYTPVPGEPLPAEANYIGLAVCSGDDDFLKAKGTVENIFESFGIKKVKFKAGGPEFYHPYRKAEIYSGNTRIGEIGEVFKNSAEDYGISKRVCIAVLQLKEMLDAADETVKFEQLPKFPAVQRDIALIVDTDVPAGDLLDCAKENAGNYFESAELFDVYTGGQLGEGKKSIAFSVILRAKDRTMLDEEANSARDAIVKAAAAKFGAKLRE
jgi:phenylalanyl-tRNA synthetase beta chain